METMSRLSDENDFNTKEKPKQIFQNSQESIWDISIHNLVFERIPFKKKKTFSYSPILIPKFEELFPMWISVFPKQKIPRVHVMWRTLSHMCVSMWTGEIIFVKALKGGLVSDCKQQILKNDRKVVV